MAVFSGNGSNTAPSFTFSSDTDTGMFRRADNELAFTVEGATRHVLTSEGRTLLGSDNTSRQTYTWVNGVPSAFNPGAQISNAAWQDSSLSLINWQNGTEVQPSIILSKSLSNTIGTHTALSNGAQVGVIAFNGSDGTKFGLSGVIDVEAAGAFGTNDTPGRMRFYTTPATTSTPVVRLELASQGSIGMPNVDADFRLLVQATTGTNRAIRSNGLINTRTPSGGGSTALQHLVSFGSGVLTGDTGVSINQGSFGGAMLLLATRNTGSGTLTDCALYLMQMYYDGNNAPAVTYLGGDGDFVTFGVSGTNTVTVSISGSGNFQIGGLTMLPAQF